ncbi:flagellar motor switch phosphatase FliY [Gottschalkia acidurici 9a]|uniref:Flagellar motor switch phosphatase FliY n=1 Tax=Gottschalkia acidurici (strain ATCC 7906 / DSM 604 / BCRC 14475 / CIP 104303 / KCTC 5404 / NCIMB 10678 / 9a) TaxID=1128398 RepID=K0B0K1_GOTA9|nr:flagellar motor switch phosphatase FliY [Gottschalkia acidurici]AFS78597.1 flagellar motor switch phosphatase FliY [Gottschalkia acidurici 9a]
MADSLLNQDEIDALLGNAPNNSEAENSEQKLLSEVEKDTLGEIGNISMGTSATTLFTLLGHKVTITTPKVSITNIQELSEYYPIPFVAINVKYTKGLEGLNLLILKVSDVKIIADLMMGGDGKNVEGDLTEIDLSAIGEAMNQMVGSSSTSLSEMIGKTIDIDPPQSYKIDFQEDKLDVFDSDDKIVKISFKMVVGDLIDSEIMQLIPLSFAKEMVKKLIGGEAESSPEPEVVEEEVAVAQQPVEQPTYTQPIQHQQPIQQPTYTQPVQQQSVRQEPVTVKKLEFQQFDNISSKSYDESIDIIQEIPVEITVQLGKTMRKIGEILEYGPGTIIELDKLLGEPLEVYANGKYIAKGEVVVIEDNFGIRITEIVSPAKRINQR